MTLLRIFLFQAEWNVSVMDAQRLTPRLEMKMESAARLNQR